MASGVTLTSHETEIYTGAMVHAYIQGDFFGTNTMMFFGMRPTETLNQPVVSHGDPVHLDDGTDHTNQEDASITGVEIPLFDPIKVRNTVKRTQVNVRPDLDLLSNLGRSHGKSIAKGKTIRLLNGLANAALTAGNVVDVDADAADSGTTNNAGHNIKEGTKEIMATMDEREVDADSRMALMKSTEWYEFNDVPGVIRADFGGAANVQTLGGNNDALHYNNVVVRNCGIGFGTDYSISSTYASWSLPAALEEDLSRIIAVIWHRDSWAYREQTTPQHTAEWIPHLQVWLVMSYLHFGFKEIQTDGIWVLRNASP